jgi:hypothetical protein
MRFPAEGIVFNCGMDKGGIQAEYVFKANMLGTAMRVTTIRYIHYWPHIITASNCIRRPYLPIIYTSYIM